MKDFRRLAARIDQHMQQLAAEGVGDGPSIIYRMMGYMPDLKNIWVGTSDQQLMALSREFRGFHRYALLMEEAAEAERKKASRAYDDMAELSDPNKHILEQLLTTAAMLEHGYQAYRAGGSMQIYQPQIAELGRLYKQWLATVGDFKNGLRAQGTSLKTLEYLDEAFGRMSERIKRLAE